MTILFIFIPEPFNWSHIYTVTIIIRNVGAFSLYNIYTFTIIYVFSRDRRRSRSRDRGGRDRGHIGGGRRSQAGANLRKPRWDLSRLEPFKKDFYVPHAAVSNRSYYQVDDWRKSKEITLKGKNVPDPVLSFEEAG